jgi:hypothetical protein
MPAILTTFVFLSSLAAPPTENYKAAATGHALKAGWAGVIPAARQWKERAPDDPVPDWLAGHAGLATGDYALASEAFAALGGLDAIASVLSFAQGLVRDAPSNAVALMLHGDALARAGKYDEALAALNKAESAGGQAAALTLNLRGAVHALAGRHDAALGDLGRAVELSPGLADAWANRGLVRSMLGKTDDALGDFDRALEIAPLHPAARNARAALLASMGKLAEAEADLRIAAQSGLLPALPGNVTSLKLLSQPISSAPETGLRQSATRQISVLSVYTGVGMEGKWQEFAGVAVETLRQRTGRDSVVIPFEQRQNFTFLARQQQTYNAFMTAAREGKNIVLVIVPHLTISGYLSLDPSAKNLALAFGRQVTLAVPSGIQLAQNDWARSGERLVIQHGAISDSFGADMLVSGIEYASARGVRAFNDSIALIAPRVGQDRVASLPSMGYSPSKINVITVRGDLFGTWLSASSIRASERGAARSFNLWTVETIVGGGIAQHFLVRTSPNRDLQITTNLVGQPSGRIQSDFISLAASDFKPASRVPDYWTFNTRSLTEAKTLASMASRDAPSKILVAGPSGSPQIQTMMQELGSKGVQVPFSDMTTLQRQALDLGASKIIGVKSLPQPSQILTQLGSPALTNLPRLVPSSRLTSFPPPGCPPFCDKFGGAGTGGSALPGGVLMSSQDLIEEARKQGKLPLLPSEAKGFLAPFLLFCASAGL